MITITWSWFSFFAGILAVLTVGFWGVVALAFNQYRKSRKKSDALTDALKSWKSGD
jgi:hypothetical protein